MLKIIICFLILGVQSTVSFPENLEAINTYAQVPSRVFAGKSNENQTFYVQMLKLFTVGNTKRIAVAGRENLFFLDPGLNQHPLKDDIVNYTEAYSWESDKETKDLCQMKGKSQEQCHNYITVLEQPSNEEVLICGTNAYSPMCRKYGVSTINGRVTLTFDGEEMSGKQRSPFGPNMPTASLFSDGSLYSATYESFFGVLSVVSRTLGQTPALRTSSNNIRNEPDFVKMTEDEEKVLIFFNEKEILSTGEKRTIPQVAQMCKNDVGGTRILHGQFTTFIKSRLNCSYNGFYLDQISDLTKPVRLNGELVMFATFTTLESSLPGSAVCSFSMSAVRHALNGPFLRNSKLTSSVANQPPAPKRHPGLCPSEKLPDEELLFVKSHPQMEKQVAGSMLLTNQGNRWTSIYVHQVSHPNNVSYMLIGTENGHLIRSLPPANDWPRGLIISETDVFHKERCSSNQQVGEDRRITKILVENDTIFIAFKHCVITVPLKWCSSHKCKSVCSGAADPFCGWNGTACTPLLQPRKIVKSDLKAEAHKPCPIETQIGKPKLKESASGKGKSESKAIISKLPVIKEHLEPKAPPEKEAESISDATLVIVAVVASLVTLVVTLSCVLMWQCCRKNRKQSSDVETLKQKQGAELHHMVISDGEKRSSISRIAQQTYRSCKELITKATTPLHSPELSSKNKQQRERRGNNYTDAPKLQPVQPERTTRSKKRLDSTSTASSRYDSIGQNATTKPLLSTPPASEHDATLSRSIADAATIRVSPKRPSHCASSPTRTSETSFVASDMYGVAPNTAVACGSATLRRSEQARQQTNDIMRESGSAIRGIESALIHMEEQGLLNPQDQTDPQRQRIQSDDSGKGESPRNSCQDELEKADDAKNARVQRPKSLNVQKHPPSQRTRLLSEGSHPYSEQSPLMFKPSAPTRERHHSAQNPMHSQPGTPVNVQQRLSLCQSNRFLPADFVPYGTAPRHEHPNHHRYNQQNQYEKLVPAQCVQIVPSVAYSPQQQVYVQRPPKIQRQMSEPQTRTQVGRSFSTSMKYAQNFYPSLQQERVPHPQVPVFQPQEQQKRPEQTGPINHYPSLPHRSSTAPYGDNNSYVTGNGFERPATLHKREKMPSMMRQLSTPNPNRGGVFVPPPTIPNNGVV